MEPSIFPQFPSMDGYVLGSLGYDKDLSAEFHARQKEAEARQIIFRLNDPTPKDYDILSDMEAFLNFNGQYGKGILCRRTH